MYDGSIEGVSNDEDWIVQGSLIDDDGAEVTLTGATMNLWICRQGSPDTPLLSGSTADGKFTLPTPTSFQWAFTPSDMSVLCAGTYDLYFRVIIGGITSQILACAFPVVEGGPSA